MACPSHDACITWVAPVTRTNGTTITGPLTYNIYRNGIKVGTVSTPSIQLVNEPTGRQCYTITAVEAAAESGFSNQSCKQIKLEAPTDGRVD